MNSQILSFFSIKKTLFLISFKKDFMKFYDLRTVVAQQVKRGKTMKNENSKIKKNSNERIEF